MSEKAICGKCGLPRDLCVCAEKEKEEQRQKSRKKPVSLKDKSARVTIRLEGIHKTKGIMMQISKALHKLADTVAIEESEY
jgi:hypothetical protein